MSPNKTLPKYRDYLRNNDAETKRGHRDHKPLVTPWVNQALFMGVDLKLVLFQRYIVIVKFSASHSQHG